MLGAKRITRHVDLRAAALSAAVLVAGCSFGPSRVHPPAIDPAAAGRGALEQYDTNRDGVIKGEELAAAPALRAALRQLDGNGDGGVSADEVADRVRAWRASAVGMMDARYVVTLNGRPLSGAEVTLEPEKFLGNEIQPCCGTSDEQGVTQLSVRRSKPEDVPGVACGLYLVRISKQVDGRELVLARYNSATTLGKEVALDAEGMHEPMIRFDLTAP